MPEKQYDGKILMRKEEKDAGMVVSCITSWGTLRHKLGKGGALVVLKE